jgi:hypothetical protein
MLRHREKKSNTILTRPYCRRRTFVPRTDFGRELLALRKKALEGLRTYNEPLLDLEGIFLHGVQLLRPELIVHEDMMMTKFAAVMVLKVEGQRHLAQSLSPVQSHYLRALM